MATNPTTLHLDGIHRQWTLTERNYGWVVTANPNLSSENPGRWTSATDTFGSLQDAYDAWQAADFADNGESATNAGDD